MDWYEEGRRWMNRSLTTEGYRLHGQHSLTHLRALLRLTSSSAEWWSAKTGFYDRMREINAMTMAEFENFYEGAR